MLAFLRIKPLKNFCQQIKTENFLRKYLKNCKKCMNKKRILVVGLLRLIEVSIII